MAIPSLMLTAILAASSSRQRPHGDMGSANSQSPLCGDDAARNEASWNDVLRLDSTKAPSAVMPGRSQTDCFAGKTSGTSPKKSDHENMEECVFRDGTSGQDFILEEECARR